MHSLVALVLFPLILTFGCNVVFLEIRKVMSKLSKEKGCEVLAEWIKPCENHLYWSASSTFNGKGSVIWAKFKTFLSHIINKHSNLGGEFGRCGHGENIRPRKWLHAGMLTKTSKNKITYNNNNNYNTYYKRAILLLLSCYLTANPYQEFILEIMLPLFP